MTPAVEEYYKSKNTLRQNSARSSCSQKYFFYDLHDGKMLYLLTQHAQWNRKFHPFLLCKCKRGEGVSDPNHVCKIIDKSEQLTLYDRSKSRWERKKARDPTYNFGKHMNWIDENNHGCSHFGIHPELLPRKNLRFDTFHLKCGITKKLMNYLRKFMLNQSITIMNDFSKTIL